MYRSFTSKRSFVYLLFLLVGLLASDVSGSPSGSGSSGDVLGVLLELIVVLLAAKLGGDLFERVGQPAVLGELLLGMLIGNLHLVGFGGFSGFKESVQLEILGELGVIILLFTVGLESSVTEMRKVGPVAFMVALFGVITPFLLGWGVASFFLPDESIYVHVFVGATLTATSVGLTARVLKDLGKLRTREAQIILGAAVIDDVMGLVILAVVVGAISAAASSAGVGVESTMILWIVAKALMFTVGALAVGSLVTPRIFKLGAKLKGTGALLSISLLICFGVAYVAGIMGLAPIVGAFAAGLVLEDVHFADFRSRGERRLEELIAPIAILLVPIFFVRMGMLVDLTTFGQIGILGFAGAVTLAAIIGKQACSLAIWDKVTDRWTIGLGMIPRGEVGLIFIGIGANLVLEGVPVVSAGTYSAVVIMVVVTTFVTPPLLKWSLGRRSARNELQN